MSDNSDSSISPFSYWVVEGEIAAGEYPGNQFSPNPATLISTLAHSIIALVKTGCGFWNTPSKKINNLMDMGISTFIDLTVSGERPDYGSILHAERRRRSTRTNYHRYPIVDRNIPGIRLMKEILDLIDSENSDGRTVYIHCFRGLGRTGTVVGCYLVRQGMSGDDALKKLMSLRKDVAGAFRGSPETNIQRQFVLDWSEHDDQVIDNPSIT